MRLETFTAIRALVGPGAGVCAHVQCQAVADTEGFATDAAHVRFFPGVDAFVFHLCW